MFRKFFALSVLFFLVALPACGQTKTVEPSENTSVTNEDKFQKTIKVAQQRYVRLQTQNVRRPGADLTVATAVRIGCKLLFSNFHVLSADSITTELGPDEKLVEISVLNISTRMDLIAIESTVMIPDLPLVKLAEKIEIGELLVNYSSANGTDGFLKTYRVAKKTKGVHIFLDRPALHGESGSGLFNLNGELVAIIDSNAQDDSDRLYGTAISAEVLTSYMAFLAKNDSELNTCKK